MQFFFDRSFLLAVAFSVGPIAVLAHGLIGAGSTFTGVLLVGSTALLAFSGTWSKFSSSRMDALFLLFVCCVVISFAWNGIAADRKELYQLVISLAAYPACRALAGTMPARGFFFAGGIVALAGSLATGAALVDQWHTLWGKPFVFGRYDAAPAQFMSSLGFLIIAAACAKLDARQTAIAAVAFAIPLAIFAASMVRSAFVAVAIAIAVSILLAKRWEKLNAVAMLCTLLLSLGVGLAARSDVSLRFLGYTAALLTSKPDSAFVEGVAKPPAHLNIRPETEGERRITRAVEGCPELSDQNSLAIRKQLYAEAWALLPDAGLFGIGMDNFTKRSCVMGHNVHNTVMQAAIEFGWPAGLIFVALIIAAGSSLWTMARDDFEARFVLCSLIFVVIMSMGHGAVSRDGHLFMLLGYAVAVKTSAEARRLKGASSAIPMRLGPGAAE